MRVSISTLSGGRRINNHSRDSLILNHFIMDYSNYFGGVAEHVKNLYFSSDAEELCLWISRFGSRFLPDGLHQELREYEDSDLSGESLSINIIGRNNMTIRVGSDNHLMVWEVKVCS